MAETLTSYAALLKEYYTSDRIHNLVYARNPFLGMVPKMTSFYGDVLPIPVITGTTRGRSRTFADALTNKGQSDSEVFQLTRTSDYALASVGREVMLASENDKGAFLRSAKVNIDGALHSVTRSLAWSLYRNSGGSVGQVATSGISTTSLTLANIHDVTNFEVGDEVEFSANEDGTSLRTGTATVTAINRDTGVLTSDSNWTAQVTAATDDDFIFIEGDATNGMAGLDDWITTTSTPAALFGVTRTTDVVRLSGVKLDATGGTPIEEALINLQSKVCREGGAPDTLLMNNIQYRSLVKSLGSKVEYDATRQVTARVFFKGVVIEGDNGPIVCYSDFNCPADKAYCLQLNTWKLYSLLEAPHLFDADNPQKMLRETSADAVEIRAGYYANLGCSAPGYNGVVSLDIPSS